MYYHRTTFRDRLVNAWLWIRYVGWIYATGLAALGLIVWIVLAFAHSTPVFKLSVTLICVLTYECLQQLYPLLSKSSTALKVSAGIGKSVGVYGLILSIFVVGPALAASIVTKFLLGTVLVISDHKGVKIPKLIFWFANLISIANVLGLFYYLAKYTGWI